MKAQITIDEKLWARVKATAALQRVSVTKAMGGLLEKWVGSEDKQGVGGSVQAVEGAQKVAASIKKAPRVVSDSNSGPPGRCQGCGKSAVIVGWKDNKQVCAECL